MRNDSFNDIDLAQLATVAGGTSLKPSHRYESRDGNTMAWVKSDGVHILSFPKSGRPKKIIAYPVGF